MNKYNLPHHPKWQNCFVLVQYLKVKDLKTYLVKDLKTYLVRDLKNPLYTIIVECLFL